MPWIQWKIPALLIGGLLVLFAAIQLWIARDFVVDDAYISLRYAQRFADGKGLTWNDGEKVEGYTNLLWVLATSPLLKQGLPPLLSARIVGITCTIAAFAIFLGYYRKSIESIWPVLGGLVLSVPVMAWSLGGMEPPMQALGVIVFTFAYLQLQDARFQSAQSLFWASIGLCLLVLTRADGFVFLAPAGLLLMYHTRILRKWHRIKVFAVVLLPALLVLTAHFLLRRAYYGEWLPNTALIKVPEGTSLWLRGVKYVGKWFLFSLPFSCAAIFCLFALWKWYKQRHVVETIILLGSSYAAYLVYIGGDFFPAFRHVVPLIWLAAVTIAEALRYSSWQVSTYNRFRWFVPIIWVVYWMLQQGSPMNRWIRGSYIEWYNAESLSNALQTAFEPVQPLIAITAAGSFPLFTRFPSIDMLGLNDQYIATHTTTHFGKVTEIGHAFGNGSYILRRQPDMIIFSIGEYYPNFLYAYEFGSPDSLFFKSYYPVKLCGADPVAACGIIWVHKHSTKLGRQVVDNALVIPIYSLLTDTTAFYAESGNLWTWCNPGFRFFLDSTDMPLPNSLFPSEFMHEHDSTAPAGRRTVRYTGTRSIRVRRVVLEDEFIRVE